jgi:RNA polymerase sigma factor (sigma-70 family)
MAAHPQIAREGTQRRAIMLTSLLETSSHRLMRQALSHSDRRADAEDALGDACVQFLRFYDGASGDPALHWMLLVVKRCAWAISRGRVAERTEALLADDRIGPAEMVERAEETEQLIEAIEQLKPDERRALILVGLGCTYEEIREFRGWSARKVRRCLDEGRARVRNLLAKGGN